MLFYLDQFFVGLLLLVRLHFFFGKKSWSESTFDEKKDSQIRFKDKEDHYIYRTISN